MQRFGEGGGDLTPLLLTHFDFFGLDSASEVAASSLVGASCGLLFGGGTTDLIPERDR